MKIEWTPDHFLAEGRFCPTSAIRSWLEEWRLANDLDWLLLLPYSSRVGDTGFGSLMIVRHDRADTAESLQTDITSATTQATAYDLADLLRRVAEQGEPRRVFNRLDWSDAEQLRHALALAPLATQGLLAGPLALFRPRTWSTKAGARFIVLGRDCRQRRDDDGEAAPVHLVRRTDLTELQTMLNATRQAILHLHDRNRPWRSQRVGREQERPTPPTIEDHLPVTDSRHLGTSEHYADLLEEAATYRGVEMLDRPSRRDGGEKRTARRRTRTVAIYFADRSGRMLRRVAGVDVDPRAEEIERDANSSSIAFVLERNRPPRIVNRVQSEPLLHSSLKPRWLGNRPEPSDFSEIVVPIASTAMGARPDVIGALVVQERSPKGEVFGARDLAFYEQLAFRISIRRANRLFSEATAALAELTGNTMMASAGATDLMRLGHPWRELPIDFANARPFLDRTMKLVYGHTQCVGAALALLGVKQRELVRVVEVGEPGLVPTAWPTPPGPPLQGVVGLANFAVLEATSAALHDFKSTGAFQPFGGQVMREGWDDLRSAVAVPVSVSDRTIGVIVVGSAQPDSLRSSTNFLEAAAQQISLSIMLAQRAEERRAFTYASSTAVHAHEILKRLDTLRSHDSSEIRRIGDEIHGLVDALRNPASDDELMAASPIDAFNDAIREIGLEDFVSWERDPPPLPPVPPTTVMAVKQAASEILKNSKVSVVSDGQFPTIAVRARISKRSQLPRLIIELQHCIEFPLPDSLVPLLYRAPIEDHDVERGRRHYGGFIAGYWLRAVGGEAYIWRAETDKRGRHWIGTAIEIPLLTLAPEEA